MKLKMIMPEENTFGIKKGALTNENKLGIVFAIVLHFGLNLVSGSFTSGQCETNPEETYYHVYYQNKLIEFFFDKQNNRIFWIDIKDETMEVINLYTQWIAYQVRVETFQQAEPCDVMCPWCANWVKRGKHAKQSER